MYRRRLVLALATLCLGTTVVAAHAADAPHAPVTLQETVVTATRTEKEAGDVPASVTVITGEDLKAAHVTTIDDALKRVESVYIRRQNGLASSMTSVELRGLPGQDRTLIMMNGLPLNDGYSGGVFWNNISTENIERIEIIRGPASALYGGNAMGGVVNVITRMPQKFEGGVRMGLGTNDTVGGASWVGDRVGDVSYRLSVEGMGTQGYPTLLVNKSPKSGASTNTGGSPIETTSGDMWTVGDKGDKGAKRYNLNTAFEWYLPEDGSVRFDFTRGFYNYYYKSPHSYVRNGAGDEIWDGTTSTGPGGVTSAFKTGDFLSGMGGELMHMGSVALTKDVDGTDLVAKTGVTFSDRWYTTPKSTKPSQDYENCPGTYTPSDRFGWFTDLQATRELVEDHLVTTGVYFRRDTFEQKERTMTDYRDTNTKGDVTNVTEGKMHQYAVFVQDEWAVADTFSLTPGLRLDAWQGFDGSSGKVGNIKELDDASAWALSPKLSALWKAMPDTSFRASVGKAFRAPNIYEMYRDWESDLGTLYISNPDLDPETVYTGEIGVDQYLLDRTLKASLTVFHSRLNDAIGNRVVPKTVSASGKKESYKVNLDEAKIEGFEAGLTYMPLEWLDLSANYTRNHTKILKNDADPAVEDNHLTDVPTDIYNLTATARYKGLTWSVAATKYGRIYTSDDNKDEPDVYGGYSRDVVIDTRIMLEPDDNWMVALNVDNVLDEKMYTGSSVAPGRSIFLEVGYNF